MEQHTLQLDPGPVRETTKCQINCNDVNIVSSCNVSSYKRSSSSEFNCSILNSFNCYYTNAQSIYHKFDELSDFVHLVVGITETWLHSDIKDSEINLDGYELFRCDRQTGIVGGTLMYIHESLNSSACSELDDQNFEDAVWRKVKLNNEE